NQVIEAEKRAQAELIKRREETAAARSQANTARLLAENPVLARVRELELLRDVLAGTKATFVFGSGDLADQVRSLVTTPGDNRSNVLHPNGGAPPRSAPSCSIFSEESTPRRRSTVARTTPCRDNAPRPPKWGEVRGHQSE